MNDLNRITKLLELHVILHTSIYAEKTLEMEGLNKKLNLRMKELAEELWGPLPDRPDLRVAKQ